MIKKLLAICIIMLVILNAPILFITVVNADGNQPHWPTSWILAEDDPNEGYIGPEHDYRDVHHAYYSLNKNYTYFRLECYGYPNFTEHADDSRYKWFIDLDDPHNMGWNGQGNGGNVVEADYLLFVEDTNNDGYGEIYLLNDIDDNGDFSEWEQSPDYWYNGIVTDKNIANYSISDKNVSLWINLENISNPEYPYFTWATDAENSNLEHAPTVDRSDVFFADLSKADLSIVKYDNKDPVAAGDSLIYTIKVANHGPHNAVNVNVTDVLPTEVTFVSSNLSYEFSGSTYWWNIPYLEVGHYQLITINVNVNSDFTGTLTNYVQAYSDTRDLIPGNNYYTELTDVYYMADLSITKSANVNTVYPGQYIEYTLVIINNGPHSAINVNISDVLPTEVTFVSSNLSYEFSGSTYWWNIPFLGINDSVTIIINVSVNIVSARTINNIAYVNSDNYDPDTEDNNDAEQVNIGSSADLSLTKTASTNFVYPGDFIEYSITITNNGPNTASNVNVFDQLPSSQLTFNSAVPDPFEIIDSTYRWYYPSIEAYQSVIIIINVTVKLVSGGTINNIAYVTSDTYDPVPGNENNQGGEQTTIGNSADLSIIKYANAETIFPGDYLEYTLIITNSGPDAAVNVNVYDELPCQITFNNANPNPTEIINSTYRWNYPYLSVGGIEIIIINVTININAIGTIINNANVTSDTHDPNPGDDSNGGGEETPIGDNIPPSKVENFVVEDANNGNLSLSWDPATDNVGVNHYEIYRDGILLTNVTTTSFTDTGLEIGVLYNYTVRAVDSTGNFGPFSDQASGISTDNIPPSKVENLTSTDAKDGKIDLSWDSATDNVAVDHYEIFRDEEFIDNSSNNAYQDTERIIGQQYSYKVRAVDTSGNIGEFSNIINQTSTKTVVTNPPSKPPRGQQLYENPNIPPVANLSAGEPYIGFIYEDIRFNGSLSYDPDGYIVEWIWDFGDRTTGNGEIVTHNYSSPGEYKIILNVTDNNGAYNIDETSALIIKPNHPPSNPNISGPTEGFINIEYNFSIISIDEDNNTIKYTIDWGDGIYNESDFLPSGSVFITKHKWSEKGNYTIKVSSDDNMTISTSYTTFTVHEPKPSIPEENNIFLIILALLGLLFLILLLLLEIRKKEDEQNNKNKK